MLSYVWAGGLAAIAVWSLAAAADNVPRHGDRGEVWIEFGVRGAIGLAAIMHLVLWLAGL